MTDRLTTLVDQDVKPRGPLQAGLDDRFDVTVGGSNVPAELIADLEGVDVLFTTSRLPLTEAVIEASSLSIIAKIGTGLDSIDLEAAEEHGVTVVYTPGMNARSVAEHALTLLLAVKRNVRIGGNALRDGKWRDEVPNASPVTDTTVGIVGFGNVGSRLAGLLSGFTAEVLTSDPYVHEIDTDVTGATLTDLETVVSESDAVVVTAELTAETEGLIDAEVLSTMKDSAVLVNTARGPIVDQDALIEALDAGSIAGAGLDVFEEEPLPADSRLHEFDNVVVTPHIAASSEVARTNIVETLADLTTRYLAGEPLPERFVATAADAPVQE
ncbi:NAD(P)-dependent oxidoreductase [Halopenitus persicus]|uniref:D-3-phosphoglycerate dehydrogenase n=1 Tax=Halopenitus persicus TaxID=1048396 RepID=A0A1H3H755_9EURY|nr:NAD(P)-dependent oxidoreductase [Halopenitus persicus]SDY11316.1 D-3-phosphoglycerate dehydrogenase [Halopenitus persicus]